MEEEEDEVKKRIHRNGIWCELIRKHRITFSVLYGLMLMHLNAFLLFCCWPMGNSVFFFSSEDLHKSMRQHLACWSHQRPEDHLTRLKITFIMLTRQHARIRNNLNRFNFRNNSLVALNFSLLLFKLISAASTNKKTHSNGKEAPLCLKMIICIWW